MRTSVLFTAVAFFFNGVAAAEFLNGLAETEGSSGATPVASASLGLPVFETPDSTASPTVPETQAPTKSIPPYPFATATPTKISCTGKNMTGVPSSGQAPPQEPGAVWSPYHFCTERSHCLKGCVKLPGKRTGHCVVMDDTYPPLHTTTMKCRRNRDCFNYRKDLYEPKPNTKERRSDTPQFKRFVPIDDVDDEEDDY
ncbi:hypothetical protein HK104_004537 [Borealophlyctis nickersoniae]|nr:hypothetical protein HK104_004537 [Borealophlyctis nickersoniae]